MNEQYVSFEVSKLLKENGFDWFTYSYYTKDDVDEKPYFGMENLCPDNWNGEVDEVNDLWFSAPTQQMACRWLREEHNIHIMPTIGCDVDRIPRIFYGAVIASFNNNRDISYHDPLDENGYNEPEDAVEAALEYVLKNLI